MKRELKIAKLDPKRQRALKPILEQEEYPADILQDKDEIKEYYKAILKMIRKHLQNWRPKQWQGVRRTEKATFISGKVLRGIIL